MYLSKGGIGICVSWQSRRYLLSSLVAVAEPKEEALFMTIAFGVSWV